ncbi:hypothetical protein ACH495_02925 [Micromonospora sp. NPDC018662]|uniref:hypothetical protein n=1 Tax=Micromonospora sp. NPDC018662 TaxID=3364238 RepID=UPI0037AEC113
MLAFGVFVVAGARRRSSWPVRLALAIGAGLWMSLAGGAMWMVSQATAAALPAPPAAVDPGNPCVANAPKKTFQVSLINVPIFLNRFGDVVPEGRMYVLDGNINTVRQGFRNAANPAQANLTDLIEPLTVRANQGDCVEISFTNRLHEAAPPLDRTVRDAAIFTLPGEVKRAAGTATPNPREFAPALSAPKIDFDPTRAPNASMHFDGLDYDVKGSDGSAVGYNPDSTAKPGQTIVYRLHAQAEGEFQFKDGADFTSRQTRPVESDGKVRFIGSHSFGAFGAIVVEASDATWVDSRSGGPLASGTRAIIKRPNNKDFREHVLFMHDEVEAEPGILTRFCRGDSADKTGTECVQPNATQLTALKKGTLPALGGGDADALISYGPEQTPVKLEWFAFNYRAEPTFNREEIGCPKATQAGQRYDANACVGEETSLSSWVYGDPGGGDLVFANYRGEPTQVRLLHPAEFETHTFHWHVNRWAQHPDDENGLDEISKPTHVTTQTNILDVQAVSPGTSYDLIVQGGAGSSHKNKKATFGDIIFHCHLYPHFATGMWGLNRTLDKLEDGSRFNPDGTPIPQLTPLSDFDYQTEVNGTNPPPSPVASVTPGFPHFVPGTFGYKAPKPPLGVTQRATTGVFPPTTLEKAAADPGAQVAGGFFQDPCPAGRPQKKFDIAAIQIDQTYNPKTKWHNPQSRVYVLESKRTAVETGAEKPEPFSPLLTVGDCVTYNLTNRLPVTYGDTVFDRKQTTNEVGLHQHMVQFDVLSSDGAANGWNYDQGADTGQTITYRDFVHENTSTNSFHDHFFANVHQDAGLFGGGTIHDAGCTFHDPKTDDPVTVGTIVSVHCAGGTDYNGRPASAQDYRNVSLFIEDHVPMFQPNNPATTTDDPFVTAQGVPIQPAKFPSSNDDQGVMGINYRLEPFEGRRGADMSRVFSSTTHGDPFTPIPEAFQGDRVKWRIFQLSQEESHGFNMDYRWRQEPKDTDSNVVGAQHIGILEYFEMDVPTTDDGPKYGTPIDRDDMYFLGGSDDLFLGAWGLMRVYRCEVWPPNDPSTGEPDPNQVTLLQPLPDNPNIAGCTDNSHDLPGPGDLDYPPGQPCPANADGSIKAPIRTFSIVAVNRDITYNQAGDHDPNGMAYALEQDYVNNTMKNEPLVIRANALDCVEITLKNRLDPAKTKASCHEAPEPGQLGYQTGVLTYPACIDRPPGDEANVPGFEPLPVSTRVSLHPQKVKRFGYSAGVNAGYTNDGLGNDRDETVGPGEEITYRWYLDGADIGMSMLTDMADPLHHQHHGLYGALVVEPRNSTHLDPATGQPLRSGVQAVISDPVGPDYRENIVLMNSDLALFRKDTNGNVADDQPVPDNFDLVKTPSREADDPEDRGEVSINYSNAPWSHRWANEPNLTNVFSSVTHGDPSTPLFQAYGGDRTVFRVGQAVGKPRSTSFALHDHIWRRAPKDAGSPLAASQGQFNPGVSYDVVLDPTVAGGAGGRRAAPGDYLYRSGTLARHLTGGQWGIFRVHATAQPNLIALPDHPIGTAAVAPAKQPAARSAERAPAERRKRETR